MLTKLVLASCIFAIVFGYSYIPPAQWQPAKEEPANYEFQYEVHDLNTWDIKRQKEKADNGKIHGEYSLVEPDGLHRRVVTYTADDEHGFIVSFSLIYIILNLTSKFIKG